jgi:tetrathionate reductase subunit B
MKTYPPQDGGPDRDRRGFFRQALGATAITAAAAAAASVTARADPSTVRPPGNDAFGDAPEALTPSGADFELAHDRSVYAYTTKDGNLAKEGFEGKRWGMLIDLRKCIGCQACTAACKFENNIPTGVFRTWVPDVELGTFPDTKRAFLPRLCNHCERPSCIEVCPAGATWQRKDGIVEIDYDLCWGCGACVNACPYDARFINPVTKTADKCTFCSQRVDQGLLPACVETCVGGARQFGDLNDPNDPVTKQVLSEVVQQLKPDTGNEPRVFYIGLTTELQNNPPGVPTLWSVEQEDMNRNDHDWGIATDKGADHV